MDLISLKITEFLDKTAGSDPVPGGGSIAALNGATAAALTEMVANLTIGRKKYEDREEQMKAIATKAADYRADFIRDIDADSDAYNMVFDAFKLPKDTDEQKAERSSKIQQATKIAAEIPLGVARRALELMDLVSEVAQNGNNNAITDAGVAMMSARSAVLGAILNVRINLGSLKDEQFVAEVTREIEGMEKEVAEKENRLLHYVKGLI